MVALVLSVLVLSCPAPVPGVPVAGFAPSGVYGGHWGVDFAAIPGTPVGTVAPGVVSFAGSVAGMLTVTVHHGGGVRTSYSYLASVLVPAGAVLSRGAIVGTSGTDHGAEVVHLSLRSGDRYLDPMLLCRRFEDPGRGLRLTGSRWAVSPYPVDRAARPTRRDFRPAPSRSSHRR